MVQLASHSTFFSSSVRMRSSPGLVSLPAVIGVTCCRPRATDLGLPEIGALSAHDGYSRHALGTHGATHAGLWNMGPRLRGDDSSHRALRHQDIAATAPAGPGGMRRADRPSWVRVL